MENIKIDIQRFQSAKKQKCVLCDRNEKIEKRLVFWFNGQVVGDLMLCNSCIEIIQPLFRKEEKILEEWDFRGGNNNGESSPAG